MSNDIQRHGVAARYSEAAVFNGVVYLAGMVGINHFGVSQPELPFGGIRESGIGHEQGPEGITHYTEIKTITIGRPF